MGQSPKNGTRARMNLTFIDVDHGDPTGDPLMTQMWVIPQSHLELWMLCLGSQRDIRAGPSQFNKLQFLSSTIVHPTRHRGKTHLGMAPPARTLETLIHQPFPVSSTTVQPLSAQNYLRIPQLTSSRPCSCLEKY